MGFRYGLHSTRLPGKPDLVLPKHNAVIWIHGCYWHGHECRSSKLPKSNESYWHPKIAKTRERDARNLAGVRAAGWRALIIWECCLHGKGRPQLGDLLIAVREWLLSQDDAMEFDGGSFRQ